MNIQEKIIQLRQIINQQLSSLVTEDYFFLDLPYYPNIGDTLIWEGSLNFFKQFNYKMLYSSSYGTFYYHKTAKSTTIFLQGGGNFGDLYPECQAFKKRIIELYPDNPIVIFPQSIHYKNQENLSQDEDFFSKHPNVTICAREENSFIFSKKHFRKNKILLVPDMAFFVDVPILPTISCREKVLFAQRLDKEINLNFNNKTIPTNAEIHDWPTIERLDRKYQKANYIWGWLDFFANKKKIKFFNRLIDFHHYTFFRKEYLRDCLNFITPYSTVYSTRLHIAIAASMLGKKVHILDNSYGKNINFYNTWLKDLDNVKPLN